MSGTTRASPSLALTPCLYKRYAQKQLSVCILFLIYHMVFDLCFDKKKAHSSVTLILPLLLEWLLLEVQESL